MILALVASAVMTTSAQAGVLNLQERPGAVLSPQPGTFYENGIGSPSVAYHPGEQLYYMVFETRTGAATPACPVGEWGLGLATSPDGFNWTVDPQPLFTPQNNSYYSCVVAHPSMVFDGRWWRVWFKSEQGTTACDNGTPSWGCARQTGIGLYAWNDSTGADAVARTPVIQGPGRSYPSVVQVSGQWHMTYTIFGDIHTATSANGVAWNENVNPSIVPGQADWMADEMVNPAAGCNTGSNNPYQLLYGGRDLQQGLVVDAGMAAAVSSDGVSYNLGAMSREFAWTDDNSYRHWDFMRFASRYVVWFTEKDAQGRPFVRVAYTHPNWSITRISPRVCPMPRNYANLF